MHSDEGRGGRAPVRRSRRGVMDRLRLMVGFVIVVYVAMWLVLPGQKPAGVSRGGSLGAATRMGGTHPLLRPSSWTLPATIPELPPEPELRQGNPRMADEVTKWYEMKLEYHRATTIRNQKRDKLHPCLPDGRMGEDTLEYLSKVEGAGYPPLTLEVQNAIWTHQHPQNCATSKFVVWRLWNTGLGADLHTLAQAIGYAMGTGRVLLIDTTATWWYAMDRGPSSLECFFIPPSSCSMDDVGED
eukprot:Sspe_Gene.100641::Locus_75310_Transcript_2_2_Confidence_0.600_Length_791::g.100641::m.100641